MINEGSSMQYVKAYQYMRE